MNTVQVCITYSYVWSYNPSNDVLNLTCKLSGKCMMTW